MAKDSTEELLIERGGKYGTFNLNAIISQELKATLSRVGNSGAGMPFLQREALDMICCKLSRIVCGDPTYIDNWDDIAGYARLVADELRGEGK